MYPKKQVPRQLRDDPVVRSHALEAQRFLQELGLLLRKVSPAALDVAETIVAEAAAETETPWRAATMEEFRHALGHLNKYKDRLEEGHWRSIEGQ